MQSEEVSKLIEAFEDNAAATKTMMESIFEFNKVLSEYNDNYKDFKNTMSQLEEKDSFENIEKAGAILSSVYSRSEQVQSNAESFIKSSSEKWEENNRIVKDAESTVSETLYRAKNVEETLKGIVDITDRLHSFYKKDIEVQVKEHVEKISSIESNLNETISKYSDVANNIEKRIKEFEDEIGKRIAAQNDMVVSIKDTIDGAFGTIMKSNDSMIDQIGALFSSSNKTNKLLDELSKSDYDTRETFKGILDEWDNDRKKGKFFNR